MTISDSAIWRAYVAANQRSATHAERARAVVPTGTSRALLCHPPFVFYIASASGVMTIDLDGNQRIDFHGNYTAQIHGHGHPRVMQAANAQLVHGTAFPAPGVQEQALAELLAQRIGAVDQVLFNNSGTEAVMVALRAARALTGRNRIGKFEGGYHGSSDFVMVGGHQLPAADDPRLFGAPHPDIGGLPAAATADVILIRFNSAAAVRAAIAAHGHELAAIIVEPVQGAGGMIPAEREFLRVLRDETRRAGIVLICDEVVTLRLATGGAQGYYGIDPDLTTMAKIIGGGFPIGALGGTREAMRVFEDGRVANLGTFSANPVSMAAGRAAMELLDEAAIADLNALGDYARQGFREVIAHHGAPAQVTGAGSLFQVHWTRAAVTDARAAESCSAELTLLAFLGLANRGVEVSMRTSGCLSTPMTRAHVDSLIAALDDTVRELACEGRFAH
jgi:glutamate-1-semialdehyde 2,1-aminomutase